MSANVMRIPSFLGSRTVTEASALRFDALDGTRRNPVSVSPLSNVSMLPKPEAAVEQTGPSQEALMEALEAERQQMHEESARVVTETIARLEKELTQLTKALGKDAIEIGFAVAQKVLELELETKPAALIALVQSALRKVAEAKELKLRLNPADLESFEAQGGSSALKGLRIAQLTLIPDASLKRGDCLVESELGHVDGRMSTRLEHVRRAVGHAS